MNFREIEEKLDWQDAVTNERLRRIDRRAMAITLIATAGWVAIISVAAVVAVLKGL